MTTESMFDAVGGHPTFSRIVAQFYARVREDDILAPMYPADDWEGAAERLQLFLEQYWGGPSTYSEQRGHPRLRMRHAPFAVSPTARDRWLAHMTAAIKQAGMSPLHEATMLDYVERAAHSMVNTGDGDAGRPSLLA